MKIIMRRVSEIIYPKNLRNDNAVRRCLPDKTKAFYQVLVLDHIVISGSALVHKVSNGHAFQVFVDNLIQPLPQGKRLAFSCPGTGIRILFQAGHWSEGFLGQS